MATYKWPTPHEWLLDKIESWGEDSLRAAFRVVVSELESEAIEDNFSNEMETDGYFEPDCQHKFTHRIGNVSAVVDYCVECEREA